MPITMEKFGQETNCKGILLEGSAGDYLFDNIHYLLTVNLRPLTSAQSTLHKPL